MKYGFDFMNFKVPLNLRATNCHIQGIYYLAMILLFNFLDETNYTA